MSLEVKPGYKMTEVGVIPSDWNVVSLGEIGLCLIGLTYSPSNVKSHGTLVLRSSNIQDGVLAFDDNVYVDSEIPEKILVQDGDILICVRNGSRRLIGKCALLDKRVAGQTFGAFMSVFRTQDSAFIFQQFQSDIVKRQIDENIGATINQITNASLNAFKIPYPTAPQERAVIATALSNMDNLISSIGQLITKKRDIKQATMQQLLTGQKRLPGFSGAWDVKRLEDLCTLGMGRTPSRTNSTYWGSGYKWLSIADLKCKVVSESSEEITKLAAKQMTIIPRGTLLMSFKLSIGRLAFAGSDLFTNEAICSFNDLKANPEYIYYALQRVDFSLYGKQAVKGFTLNKASLKLVEVAIPSLAEQNAIARTLSDIDAELTALEARRNKVRQLKQGMMQELLTGRIRLLDKESA